MQPYQEASEEMRRRGEQPFKALKTVASAGASVLPAVAGAKIIGKVMPFLSKYIPTDLAIKGLSKIDPRFGKFIKKSMQEGYDFDEVKEFIQEKVSGAEKESEQPAQENTNIIQQFSPALHEFIDEQLKRGRSPLEAGAIAQNDKRFSDAINKITKAHKSPWSAILQTVYGGQQEQQQNQGATQSVAPQQTEQQPQHPGQPGQGQQALMAILQKIQQARGGQG